MARTQSESGLIVVRRRRNTPKTPDQARNGMAGLSEDEPDTKQQRKSRLIDEAPGAGVDVGVRGPFPQQEDDTGDEERDGETGQNNAILPQLSRSSTVRPILSILY